MMKILQNWTNLLLTIPKILCVMLSYIVFWVTLLCKNTKCKKCEIFHFLNVLRPCAECVKYNNDDHLMNPCLQQHNCLNLWRDSSIPVIQRTVECQCNWTGAAASSGTCSKRQWPCPVAEDKRLTAILPLSPLLSPDDLNSGTTYNQVTAVAISQPLHHLSWENSHTFL